MGERVQKRQYVPGYSFIKSNPLMNSSMGTRIMYMSFWGFVTAYTFVRVWRNKPSDDVFKHIH